MFTRWQKVWSDFWSNKTRTALMVLTIMVGVFSVGMVNNMAHMMNNDMDADFLSTNPSEAKIYAYPLDEAWVRALRRADGVGDVEGRTQLMAQWQQESGEKVSIQFSSVKSLQNIRVDRLKAASPDEPLPVLKDHEVVFDRSAQVLGLIPGETVKVELPDGRMRKLTFKGYVHDATTFPFGMAGMISAYITQNTAEWMGAQKGYNQLLISVAENPTDQAHVSEVAQSIADRMQKNDVSVGSVSIYNPGHHFAWQITQGVIFILSALGWMTVVLSAFLIVNTIVALMSQHVRQIGMMKAIGADGGQIFPMYFVLILSFGAVAFAISAPLSVWVAYKICGFMAVYLNYELGVFKYFEDVVVLQALVAFLTPLIAALWPIINSLRIPVREALNTYGLGGGSQKPSEPKEFPLTFISRPVLVSLRNAFRRKARVGLTIFTLVLGGAIFIAVFNLWGSFDKAMQDAQGYFLADINVSFTSAHRFDSVKSIAMKVPGVESVEGWLVANGKILSSDGEKEDEIAFVAPPSTSTLIKPTITAGRWLTPQDKNAIVIGNHLLKIRPDLSVGDWVTLKIDGRKKEWQIVGFYRMPGNINPPLVYTNYEYLSYLVGTPNQVYELRVNTYDHDAQTQSAVALELQALYKKNHIPVGYIQQAAVWYQQQKSQTDVLVYFMLVMAVLIAVVGGLGLMGTMSLNVLERTREIGVMRSIGAADGDIQRIVITEGLVIGLLSWLVGMVFAIPITYLLDYGVGVAIFQSPLAVVFNGIGSITWLIGILFVAALASAAPAWRASRLSVRETLVYE
jgi:putative ABC transport system permease protein